MLLLITNINVSIVTICMAPEQSFLPMNIGLMPHAERLLARCGLSCQWEYALSWKETCFPYPSCHYARTASTLCS